MGKARIYFDDRQEAWDLDEATRDLVRGVIETGLEILLGGEEVEVSVSFVDDGEIQALNRDYRGRDQVTDVLSFPFYEAYQGQGGILGDIVINASQCLRQAKEYGHSFEREVTYLAVHSLLHLLGHDHEEEEDKRVMRAKEEEVLSAYKKRRGD